MNIKDVGLKTLVLRDTSLQIIIELELINLNLLTLSHAGIIWY
jgi:hypothetical protein